QEQPLQIVDAARDAHLIADRPQDVVGGQDREDVEPGPAERRHLRRPDLDHAAEQAMEQAFDAGIRGGSLRRGVVHCVIPSRLRSSPTGNALPNSGVPGAKSMARASGSTTGSTPASRASCEATLTASGSSPATGMPIFSPPWGASPSKLRYPTGLNARTSRAPGRYFCEVGPMPFAIASLATSPS